ncbi:MAG: DNRLRE domain-containing protein [Candidatus Cloacimonadia bacterium]
MKSIPSRIIIIFLIISTFFVLSCSDDKITGSHNIPDVADTTVYNAVKFDSVHTLDIANYPNNTKLVIGNFNNTIAKALLKFRSLPDTTWLDTVQLQDCKIELKKDTLYSDESFDLEAYRLNENWDENTVTADSLLNGETELLATFYIEDSIVTIDIDTTLVRDWIVEDTLNFGLIIVPAENCNENFVEFYSSESNFSPSMKITYMDSSGNSDTLSIHATDDTFISAWNQSPPFDTPVIANLPPTEMVVKIELTPDSLKLTEAEFQMIVINRAEIIIDRDCISTYYFSDDRIGIIPYSIIDTTEFSIEYISGCETTHYYANRDSLFIDISGILQGYTRGEIEGLQIAVRFTTFNKDFSFIEFADTTTPKLKIIYTSPILADKQKGTKL